MKKKHPFKKFGENTVDLQVAINEKIESGKDSTFSGYKKTIETPDNDKF